MSGNNSPTGGLPSGRDGAELSAFFYVVVSSHRAVSVHTDSGDLALFNPTCTGLLGYGPGELSTKTAPNIVHPDDEGALTRAATRARDSSGEPVCLRVRLRHRLGHAIPVELELSSLTVGGRDFTLVVSTPIVAVDDAAAQDVVGNGVTTVGIT